MAWHEGRLGARLRRVACSCCLALVGAAGLFAQGGTAPPIAAVRRDVPKLPIDPDAVPPAVVPSKEGVVPPGSTPTQHSTPTAPPRLKP